MNTFALAKQCVPLLQDNGEPTDLLLWIVVPLAAILAIPPFWRFLTGGNSHREASNRAVIVSFGGCALLLAVGWLAYQFLTPTC